MVQCRNESRLAGARLACKPSLLFHGESPDVNSPSRSLAHNVALTRPLPWCMYVWMYVDGRQRGDVLGAAAMFHTGAWAVTATAVSRACHLALFQPSQLLHLCLRVPSLGRKLLCVLGYHAMLGQREYGFCDNTVRGALEGGGGGGGGSEVEPVAEIRGGARRRALLRNIFAEDTPLRNDKLGGDAHVRTRVFYGNLVPSTRPASPRPHEPFPLSSHRSSVCALHPTAGGYCRHPVDPCA